MFIHAPRHHGMVDWLTLNRGRRTTFQNKMVDPLAIYVLNRYPALVSFIGHLSLMAVGLVLGCDADFSSPVPSPHLVKHCIKTAASQGYLGVAQSG